jgi:predicted component of type VI protein secretion system
MDPQNTWDQLLCAYRTGDWDAIEERATELLEWLDRGGTPPRVLDQDLDAEWHRALARAGCLFAIETVQGEWCLSHEPAS